MRKCYPFTFKTYYHHSDPVLCHSVVITPLLDGVQSRRLSTSNRLSVFNSNELSEMVLPRDLRDSLSFQHEAEYKSILSATKSGASEKRLAAQFIPRFFKYFPHLSDQAIDAQTDLCEDSDVSVSTVSFLL